MMWNCNQAHRDLLIGTGYVTLINSFFSPPFHVVRIPFCSVAIGVPITFPPDIASSYVATAVDCRLSSGEQMCARKTRNYANLS